MIPFFTKQITPQNPFSSQGKHFRPPFSVREETVVFPRRKGREVDDGNFHRKVFSVLFDFDQSRKSFSVTRKPLLDLPQNTHFFDEIHMSAPKNEISL